jgi:hypothetical protein
MKCCRCQEGNLVFDLENMVCVCDFCDAVIEMDHA